MSVFAGKVVLITGAGRGLGAYLARAWAAAGAVVAVNDLNPDHADQVVGAIRAAGGQAREYLVDVSKKMPLQQMFNQVEDDWGGVDFVINNAAVRPRQSLLDIDEWDLHRTVEVNLIGPFLVMQMAGRLMRARGQGGVIVQLGSTPEYARQSGAGAAYVASKGGLEALTLAAAAELAPYQVRVHAVRLGAVALAETLPTGASTGADVLGQPIVNSLALAEALFALCSPAAAHLTGQIISAPNVITA